MTNKEIEKKYYSDTLKVSKAFFDHFNNALDCKVLSEEGRLKDVIKYQNKFYTPVSSCSFWNKKEKHPRHIITAHEVQALEHYSGSLKPLPQPEHQKEVNDQKRERGYYGQLVKFRNNRFAICEHRIKIESENIEQLSLIL